MINEDCCYRDPLGVFRTVSVEWNMSWESISYGEILIMICDGWHVRLPRRGELEDDVRSLELPRRSVRHVVEGHVVQFDPPGPEDGVWPWGRGAEWTWALNHSYSSWYSGWKTHAWAGFSGLDASDIQHALRSKFLSDLSLLHIPKLSSADNSFTRVQGPVRRGPPPT